MGHLLLAVASLLGALQLSSTQDECEYPDCVLRRVPNRHLIETAFVYLNFTALPDTFPSQCSRLTARFENCSSLYLRCARTVQKEFAQRYQDGVFVHYVMQLGTYVCRNLLAYMGLKRCFTTQLETALQSCITGQRFDLPCLSSQFNATSNCTSNNNYVFHFHITNWLPRFPYYTNT